MEKSIRFLTRAWSTRKKTLREWERFETLYYIPDSFRREHKPTRPKWGQPGRRRRRKARFQARVEERG